ncbi:MAG: endolytic transglycosylase MltG [Myxococcaceae bacterium]|nr:endolytic transglycosylase MltG [Myxococcaceae bacterium]
MKKVIIGLAVLLVVAALGAAAFWYLMEKRLTEYVAAPFGSDAAKTVEIPPGTNPKGVATLLAQGQVVRDADLFYAYLKRDKLGPKLKAGEYEFKGALTPTEVAELIMSGKVKQYRFTVPEGLRVDEILPIVAESDLKLDLKKLQALAASPKFVRSTGVPADVFEGFLFPDTYSFPRGATAAAVLQKMAARTLEEVKRAPRKAGVELDTLQAVTLASIVEKETGAVEERPRISCVFHNRLRLKMKLQTDPTVIYAMMLLKGVYSKNITKADLTTEHPYNTYTMKGLPPGPIASPGEAAIRAALSPIDCNDLFFVSQNNGTHIFCPDLKCHEAAVEKWQVKYFKKKKADEGGSAEP